MGVVGKETDRRHHEEEVKRATASERGREGKGREGGR